MEHLSKSPVFPTEIIELIMDHVQDDIVALTRISGTSHAVRHSCHRRLFRSLEFNGIPPTPYTLFIRLFQSNPSIGQHVRELVLDVDNRLSKWVPGIQNAKVEYIQTFTQTPFVAKLTLRSSVGPTLWNSLSATLQQPILNRIHSAFLRELFIECFVIPITIFRYCVNLSALTISRMEVSAKPELIDQARMSPHSLQPTTIPQLRSLELGNYCNAFALALVHYRDNNGYPLLRFDGLKTLIVSCSLQNKTQVLKDICKEAIGLETLTCRGIRGAQSWPDFSCFSMLKTLKGQCRIYLTQTLLQGLSEQLQMFAQPNVLETLDIDVIITAGITARSCYSKSISARNEWGQLDIVLSHGFPRLHTVSINVVWPYSPLANPESESAEIREAVRVIREKFPWLNGNPAVKFNFSMSLLRASY